MVRTKLVQNVSLTRFICSTPSDHRLAAFGTSCVIPAKREYLLNGNTCQRASVWGVWNSSSLSPPLLTFTSHSSLKLIILDNALYRPKAAQTACGIFNVIHLALLMLYFKLVETNSFTLHATRSEQFYFLLFHRQQPYSSR